MESDSRMLAWLLKKCGNISKTEDFLELSDIPIPEVKPDEILIEVKASGVCHTEIDEIEGRIAPLNFPIILGHQIVGVVKDRGREVTNFREGDRAAVAWISSSCGKCHFCKSGFENLCDDFKATGKDKNGGYAQYTTAKANYAYKIENEYKEEYIAPLLCAGAVGYRSLKLANIKDGESLGFTGFGASAHIVQKIARILFPNSPICVFARREEERNFALELGAYWAGDIGEIPPFKLKAIIDTTPVWKPIISSLEAVQKGGRVVINAIRKEILDKNELINVDYAQHLWLEKEIKSVANVTRKDVEEFLSLAFRYKIEPQIERYSFENAKSAIIDMKEKRIRGAKVLIFE